MSRNPRLVAPFSVARLALVPDAGGGEVVVLPDAGAAERASDADLVRRARGGDDWAHEMIYRRHVGLVAATAQRMLRDPVDVDDVVRSEERRGGKEGRNRGTRCMCQ